MLEVTPVLHHGNGGIKVNASSEVVCTREDGTASVLIGLYAVGECAGGVHGAERLSGNGLLDSMVFGTNAGRRAADSVRLGEAETAVDSLPDWTPLRLRHRCKMEFLSVKGLSHLSKQGLNDVPTEMYEFCFELPSTWSRLNIPPGAAVAVKAHINGTDIIRHYTPISRPDSRGSVSLYLKALPDKGVMSRHLFFLRPGDTVQMMGPATFPRMTYAANGAKLYPEKMVMLAGGSGVAPMIHLIADVVQRGVSCQMVLLWGVESERDLVFRQFLDHTQAEHPDKLKVVYCVSATMMAIRAGHLHMGLIDSHLLHVELLPAFRPDDDVTVVICGPQKMSVAMMAALAHMGYHEDKVFSFNK
jgi:cytochrome-b5 reductase